ncbi:MDR family MFS transporter [Chengkuizengella sp. SCS-71B]|uniref:MDR family MFS transporter n=1 Tax=Chengkuizengella sp. SCS-71B TaxID=3115290 RepID=UPI0032C21DC9
MIQQKQINTRIVLLGLMIGMFFSALEQTVVGTAMPTIIGELNGFEIFAWVTTAYLITSTAVIPIVGKISDLFGRRYLYLTGMVIFIVGSALCATATTMEQLIIFRGIQGIGGGMIMPLSQTIVGDIFTAEQRAKWQGVFGAIFGLSSVIGPLVGGFFVDTISWHWIFLINVPFGVLSATLIFIGMKNEIVQQTEKVSIGLTSKISLVIAGTLLLIGLILGGDTFEWNSIESYLIFGIPLFIFILFGFIKRKELNIDFFGIMTLIPALTLLLLGLTFGGDKFAWLSFTSYIIFGISILLIIIFIFIERKTDEPILDLSLFKNRVFATTNGLGFLLGLGMFGAIMFVPMFMQAILGVSPTEAGSTMTPMMISLIVASVIGGRLLLRIKYRTNLTVGMIITSIGFFLMSTMGLNSTIWTAYGFMIVMGFGMGLVMPTLMIAVQNAFPKEKLGSVTSASTFFRSIGGTIGVTIFNVVMNNTLSNKMSDVTSQQSDPTVVSTLTTIGDEPDDLFGILITTPNKLKEILPIPEETLHGVVLAIKTAWSQSFSFVFLTGLSIIALGIFVALSVGNGRIKRDKKKSVIIGKEKKEQGMKKDLVTE